MLHAKIETLGVDPQNGSVVVLLRTENDKLLPIVIGPLEAHHIVVARKTEKPYMINPVSRQVLSITTGKPQLLVLDGADIPRVRGKKVAIVDDVVSTGSTLAGLRELIESVGGEVVAVLAVFTEGTPRQDVVALGHLPLFKPE